jgi:galactoside O-acetyltransferase
MSGNWLSLKQLRKLGVTILGTNIHVSKDCRIYNPSKIILHDNIRIDDFTLLAARGPIELFNYVHIASHCLLSSGTRIEVHNFANIASGSKLIGSTDDFGGNYLMGPTIPKQYLNVRSGDIILNKHVILGSNTIVLPSVNFGEGTAVGASSLIWGNTDPWSIYIGTPAKKLRDRNKGCIEMAKQLQPYLK